MADRRYDAFVIRLWRDRKSARWLRVDLEHLRAAERTVERWPADAPDAAAAEAGRWILERLRAAVEPPAPDDAGEESSR